MRRLMDSPEYKARKKQDELARQERLKERFENGDKTLKKTILGKIVEKPRETVIKSAEGSRYAITDRPLPKSSTSIETDLGGDTYSAREPSRLARIGRVLATGGLSLIFERDVYDTGGIPSLDSEEQWADPSKVVMVNGEPETESEQN